ncbi:MAG: hypothetical protein H6721_14090 [Sandaracinus sp.]|nr:hypothetical protein [Sandaracinus sp.]
MSAMIVVFAEEEIPLNAASLKAALAALEVRADVRDRAFGFLLDDGAARWEIRRIRASDLTRELGPRLRDAPASIATKLRRMDVGYVVPRELFGGRVAVAVAQCIDGFVCADGAWSRVGPDGVDPIR